MTAEGEQPENPNIVYFIAAWEISRVKIGTTTRRGLARRMSQLNVASPVEMKLLGYHAGGRREERHVHERFASARIGGEWFDLTPEIMEYVDVATIRELPPVPEKTKGGRPKRIRKRRQPIPAMIDHVDGSAVVRLKISPEDCQTIYAIHGSSRNIASEPELAEICGRLIRRAVMRHRRKAQRRAMKVMAASAN